MIQSGDGNWIINSHPSATDYTVRITAKGLQKMHVLTWKRAFYLAVSLRQIKTSSLRPRRLCDENFILDKYVFE
jgi:hypothetical protein